MNAILPIVEARIAQKGARWSESEIARAIRLRRDEAKTVPQIAAALGRTTATVYTQLRKYGVIVQEHRPWRAFELAAALDALADGRTYADAAAAIGRTESELRSKIAYDRIVVPARRSAAPMHAIDAAARGDNFAVALRAEITAEQRPLKELARIFGVSVAALSKFARGVHGRSYRSAATRDAMRAALARARAAKAAKADQSILWTADAIARLKTVFDAANGAPDLAEVARAFGSTPRMVDKIARAHGLRALKRARRGLTEEAKRRAGVLASQGVLITPAACALGVDIRTLREYAAQAGIVFVASDRRALAKRASMTLASPRVENAPRVESATHSHRRAEDRAATRAERIEARRLAALARKEARETARAQAKADRALAKKLAEAHAREAKRRAMLATAVARPKKAKPAAPKRDELAALVADYIAKQGVTRALLTDVDLAVAAIRRRGYGVTREGGVYRIDQMTVPAAELFAFAEKRGIKWKERSAA